MLQTENSAWLHSSLLRPSSSPLYPRWLEIVETLVSGHHHQPHIMASIGELPTQPPSQTIRIATSVDMESTSQTHPIWYTSQATLTLDAMN